MTKEQEKAIERCKELTKEAHACWIGISNQKAIETILFMLEEKDKQIDLMAEYISEIDVSEDLCEGIVCNEDDDHCKVCIKQYFENEVRQESDKSATGK